jgi:hypothetical protein
VYISLILVKHENRYNDMCHALGLSLWLKPVQANLKHTVISLQFSDRGHIVPDRYYITSIKEDSYSLACYSSVFY